MSTPRLRLGQLLVDAGLIRSDELASALEKQARRGDGTRLGTILVAEGLISEVELTQILSHQLSVPWVSLLHIEFSRQLLNLVQREIAERFCLVPIYVRHVRRQGQTLYVAMEDPSNDEALGICQTFSGLPTRPMIAPPSDIRNAIRVYYGGSAPEEAPISRRERPARRARRVKGRRRGAVGEFPTGPSQVPEDGGGAEAAELPLREVDAPVEEVTPQTRAVPPPADVESSTSAVRDVAESDEPSLHERGPEPDEEANEDEIDVAIDEEEGDDDAVPLISVKPFKPSKGALALGRLVEAEVSAAGADEDSDVDVGDRSGADTDSGMDAEEAPIPAPPRGAPGKMVSLTLLDGTSITLPARNAPEGKEPTAAPEASVLTARDLVSALRAVAHGADASEILGEDPRWEAMFAALLSLLMRKHLIADWEFVEEYKRI